jgi:hypothetical protein
MLDFTNSPTEKEGYHTYLDMNDQDTIEKFNMPLTTHSDAEKLKELAKRFRCAEFHVTNTVTGGYYRVISDGSPMGDPRAGIIEFYSDAVRMGTNFPRPFKIHITLCSGLNKDITYLFD